MAFALRLGGAEREYPREIAQWQEVSIPPEADRAARIAWSYAANYSKDEWRTFVERNQICAQLESEEVPSPPERPKFTPKAGRFRGASVFAPVDDGWLVAFNEGEFGAALYWFSHDGKRKRKISDHQVVAFFSLPDGLHAIEGLAHMFMSEGSIIRITRPERGARWQASTVTRLPFAPYAVSVRRDGTMLITLSDSLVSVGADHRVITLLQDAPWRGLYPNSSVLSFGEQKLYIGMRQFVGEFDIPTRRLRLLVPSNAFLNKLPEEVEQRIHKHYGG